MGVGFGLVSECVSINVNVCEILVECSGDPIFIFIYDINFA